MRYILFPLIFLICFAFMAQLGITSQTWNSSMTVGGASYWTDQNDHIVMWQNGTAAGEAGTFDSWQGTNGTTYYQWYNSSGLFSISNPSAVGMVGTFTFSTSSAIGVIAMISALMAIGVVAGVSIFGSGLSGASVLLIVQGTALIGLWGIFSALSLNMITAIPWFGPIFYFFLTCVYTVGIMQQVGGGGED